jgi:DNA-binding XRE family transcriptional regulator
MSSFKDMSGTVTPSGFAQRLKTARQEVGFTQEDLDKACGFGRASVYRYECGNVSPSIAHLARICEALGCSADSLLGLSPSVAKTAPRFSTYERRAIGIRLGLGQSVEQIVERTGISAERVQAVASRKGAQT